MKRLNNLYDDMISYSKALFVYDKIRKNCHNKKKIFEFIKYKNRYYTYGNDLRNMNGILKTKSKSFNYRNLIRLIIILF